MISAAQARQRVTQRTAPIYAIGDIHGRADLLAELLIMIRARAGEAPTIPIVCLGDYVDRGLQSREVIDLLLAQTRDPRLRLRFLKGNHEAAMLDFLARPTSGAGWLVQGGAETLYSYGVQAPPPASPPEALLAASEALRAALPPAHLDFLSHLERWFRHGDYLFVHAGLNPARALEEQSEADLFTIREPFFSSRKRWPFVVVHGHTPSERVHIDAKRIGVDTGAYMTGKLSAVRLDGDSVEVIST